MNLTNQPVYTKGENRPKSKRQSPEVRRHFARVAALGCIISNLDCGGKLDLHHPTGAGWGKKADDFDVIPLCVNHHSAQTPLGFGHAVHKGTRTFESNYGSQAELLAKVRRLLDNESP